MRPVRVISSLIFSLILVVGNAVSASSMRMHTGKYSEKDFRMEFKMRFASWMYQKNGKRVAGSSRRIILRFFPKISTMLDPGIIFNGKSHYLKKLADGSTDVSLSIAVESYQKEYKLTLQYIIPASIFGRSLMISNTFTLTPVLVKGGGREHKLKISNDRKVRTGFQVLKDSEKKWKNLNRSMKGNYSYTLSFGSFSGFGSTTVVTVRNNKIFSRNFRRWKLVNKGGKMVDQTTASWIENKNELGKKGKGFKAYTMNNFYEQARKVLQKKLEKYQRIVFSFNSQGVLLRCCTVDTRIVDDVPCVGVNLSSVQK
ncbi:MAG: hypothetical protein JXR95_14995 [Deltaproteobacteria bacterium]|nr:hypothetical protein [Deltaproteobacteria bacterium]